MSRKTIAVRLHPRLEEEGRGLCDPEDPRNKEVLTPSNYGAKGYLRVYPSGFIQAQIRSGTLVRIPERNVGGAGKGAAEQGKTSASRTPGRKRHAR
ncbi:MAG: hypothetical protein JSW54_13690 [Fidelibacterota bacterium]|nr:MAG: hypothetical protein JSW54_13690 [Candidatus Neomarinimicrobiota bacterium]